MITIVNVGGKKRGRKTAFHFQRGKEKGGEGRRKSPDGNDFG